MENVTNKKRVDDLLEFVVEEHDKYLEAQQLHKNGTITEAGMKHRQWKPVKNIHSKCIAFRTDLDFNTYEIDFLFQCRMFKISGECHLSETQPGDEYDGCYVDLTDASIDHINEPLRTYNPRAYDAFDWLIDCMYSRTPKSPS